jgi:hypothetical protein
LETKFVAWRRCPAIVCQLKLPLAVEFVAAAEHGNRRLADRGEPGGAELDVDEHRPLEVEARPRPGTESANTGVYPIEPTRRSRASASCREIVRLVTT